MRKIVKMQLLQLGYGRISEADSMTKAVELLKNSAAEGPVIDIILCDWKMPGQSGLDLLAFCRSKSQFKDLPFLMVTGEDDPERLEVIKEASPSGLLIKPFSAGGLKQSLDCIYRKDLSRAS